MRDKWGKNVLNVSKYEKITSAVKRDSKIQVKNIIVDKNLIKIHQPEPYLTIFVHKNHYDCIFHLVRGIYGVQSNFKVYTDEDFYILFKFNLYRINEKNVYKSFLDRDIFYDKRLTWLKKFYKAHGIEIIPNYLYVLPKEAGAVLENMSIAIAKHINIITDNFSPNTDPRTLNEVLKSLQKVL